MDTQPKTLQLDEKHMEGWQNGGWLHCPFFISHSSQLRNAYVELKRNTSPANAISRPRMEPQRHIAATGGTFLATTERCSVRTTLDEQREVRD